MYTRRWILLVFLFCWSIILNSNLKVAIIEAGHVLIVLVVVLHLLDASVSHLGTDVNYVVLSNLVDFYFYTYVNTINLIDDGYEVVCFNQSFECEKCIVSVARSGSKCSFRK